MSKVPTVVLLALIWTVGAQPAAADDDYRLSVKGGMSFFMFGQSNALPHRLKPNVRLEAEYHQSPELSFDLEVAAVADGNRNYRVMGVLLGVSAWVYRGEIFQLAVTGGWGLGTGPRILFADLSTQRTVTGCVKAGAKMRWTILKNRLNVGLDLLSENLSMATLVATFGFHL